MSRDALEDGEVEEGEILEEKPPHEAALPPHILRAPGAGNGATLGRKGSGERLPDTSRRLDSVQSTRQQSGNVASTSGRSGEADGYRQRRGHSFIYPSSRGRGDERGRVRNRGSREQSNQGGVEQDSDSDSVEAGQIASEPGSASKAATPELRPRAAGEAGTQAAKDQERQQIREDIARQEAEKRAKDRRAREELAQHETRRRAQERLIRQAAAQKGREKRAEEQRVRAELAHWEAEEKARVHMGKEAATLVASIKHLTGAVQVQHLIKSFDAVVRDLRDAIREYRSLLSLKDKMKVAFPGLDAALVELPSRILGGLRSMFVFSATGAGQARIRGSAHARDLVRTAVRHAIAIFDAAQHAELRGFVAKSKTFQALLEDFESMQREAQREVQRMPHNRAAPHAVPFEQQRRSGGAGASAPAAAPPVQQQLPHVNGTRSFAAASEALPIPQALPPPPLPQGLQQPDMLPSPLALPPPPPPAPHPPQEHPGQMLPSNGEAMPVQARSADAPSREPAAKRSRTEPDAAQPLPWKPDQAPPAASRVDIMRSSPADLETDDDDDEDALLYPPTPPPDMIPLESSSDASEPEQAPEAVGDLDDMELCYIPIDDLAAPGGQPVLAPGMSPDLPPGLDTPGQPQSRAAAAPAAEHAAPQVELMRRESSNVLPPGLAEPAPADTGAQSADGVPITAQAALPNGSSAGHRAFGHQQQRNILSNGSAAAAAAAAAAADSDVDMLDDMADDVALAPLPPAAVQRVQLLLAQRRLCLVLDLDHTLLNSARFTEVDQHHTEELLARLRVDAQLPEAKRGLFRLEHIGMWTKLRPGVRDFLAAAAPLFEMWIHTNGTWTYAQAIVELLDPTGNLFGGRIITSSATTEDGAPADQAKSLMQGLEGYDAVALIIDDTSRVWPDHARNLLAVERYLWFPAARRQFRLAGPSLMEQRRDETAGVGMLAVVGRVLQAVHAGVFEALGSPDGGPGGRLIRRDWDVRTVLHEQRMQVLAGVRILFTGLIPLDQLPETHALWRMAQAFGARCVQAADEGVTHVIAKACGTEKVLWALRRGKHVVSKAWLECSCTLWKRAEEDRFPVAS